MTDSDSKKSLVLCTCSAPVDLELFALLAASVDECADDAVRHLVVVPGANLSLYDRFRTSQRDIIAQEDLLPFQIYRLPSVLKRLAFLAEGLRRPLYLTGNFNLIRGWLVQQLIKMEMSRRSEADVIMHVDSDVFFVRPFGPEAAFCDGRPYFFRATGQTANPMHQKWNDVAAGLLNVAVPDDFPNHYVENCVVWSPDVVRDMIARIEQHAGRALPDILTGLDTISEYYVYGQFVDLLGYETRLAPRSVSFCNSYWAPDQGSYDFDRHMRQMQPQHIAVAVQSTHTLSATARLDLRSRVMKELGHKKASA